jgi:hypothetical protein
MLYDIFCMLTDLYGVVAKSRQREHLLRRGTPRDVLPVPAHPHFRLLLAHLEEGVSQNSTRGATFSRW